MTTTAQAETGGATYRVLRELGSRAQHTHAAIREPNELVIVQRFVRTPTQGGKPPTDATPVTAEAMALLLRDARSLAKNWHPNIARVRHVDLVGPELYIATELVDGATLGDLLQAAAAHRTNVRDPVLPLPLLVRIIVDVLGGLHGLHGLRDAMNTSLDAIHGELCPTNIVVGKDGVARLIAVFRSRPVKTGAGSEGLGYAAPEALDASGTGDVRADLYGVGVILWEALTGRRLWGETDPARIRARQREEELVRPDLPDASPFARLADVAMRALSFDPALRHKTASEMATELRRIAGTRIAPGSSVAQTVAELAGERIRARRAELDPSAMRRRAESLAAVEQHDDLHTDEPTFMGIAIPAALGETPPVANVEAPKAPDSSPKPPASSPSLDKDAEPKATGSVPKPPASSPSLDKDAKDKAEGSGPKLPKDEPSSPGDKKAPAPRPVHAAPTRPVGFVPFPLGGKPEAKQAAKPEPAKSEAAAPAPVAKEPAKTPAEKALAPTADVKIAIADAPAPPFALAPSLAPPSEKAAEAKAPEPEAAPEPPRAEERPSLEPSSVDHVHVAAVPAEALPVEATDSADVDGVPRARPRRRNLVPIVGAVVGLAVVVLVGGLLAMNKSHDEPAKTPDTVKTTAVATQPPVEPTATATATATATSTVTAEPATPPEPSTVTAEPATPPEPSTTVAAATTGAPSKPATTAAPPPVVRPTTQPPSTGRPTTKKKKTFDPQGI